MSIKDSNNNLHQILDRISRKKFKTPLKMLSTVMESVINISSLNLIGGRVWELDLEKNAYILKYQAGSINKIPLNHSQYLSKEHIYSQLADLLQNRTIQSSETDETLKKAGVEKYVLTGVGEIIRLGTGKYFEYLISFDSKEFKNLFFDSLTIISSFCTISLRNLHTQEYKSKIDKDIDKASEIQRNLLPQHYIEYLDYEVFGVCIPDRGVGGDYFDYIRNSHDNDQEQLSIIISDAASKGLPAAIQSLFVSGAIRMGMSFATRITHIFSLLNNLLFKTFPRERFVSMFWCELTSSSNRMVLFSNAGHCSPIHYRPSLDRIKYLPTTGPLLGIAENQTFAVENVRMNQGDILVLYTDGISEAQDENGNLFGEIAIANLVKKHYRESPKIIAYNIIEEVQKYCAKSIYNDDKTLVVIKRKLG